LYKNHFHIEDHQSRLVPFGPVVSDKVYRKSWQYFSRPCRACRL